MKKKLLSKIITVLIFICSFKSLYAQNEQKSGILRYNGFQGGMMLHAGYLSGSPAEMPGGSEIPFSYKASGITKGIGGAARVRFGEYWRVGTEGYVSTLSLNKDLSEGSYVSSAWGGVLTDFYLERNRWSFFIGTTLGVGARKNLLIFEGSMSDWKAEENAYFHKNTFFAIDPFLGVEFAITDVIHLVFRVDCLLQIDNKKLSDLVGPRAYIGFMFCR
ncbi:MAG: hypothetical protein GX993_03345 [Bacteroidales bacterium]|nr:hypothetical protein [Bacteroidales bacterium]